MTAAVDRLPAPAEGRGLAWSVLGAVLVLDGLLTLALEVLFLPLYIGGTPVPISAAVAAVVNIALIAGMGAVVARPAAMSLPLVAWLLGFLFCSTAGPGGDVMLTDNWASPLLLACGLVPAGFYLFRRAFPAHG